ncbi:MAG: right-handed parallel beta-helix repeat-containing protein, partial [Candidatus Thermoplasmatota archaeon]|nr:right-handed parallel beta-helix repeat-containing protein [Candidatus Thermoplasmatota archaeon]
MNKGTTFAISAVFTMIAAAILILGIDLGPSDLLVEDAIAQVMGPITVGRYTSSGPIRIDSNADFSSSPAVSSGDGSVANPWIIEGFDINGSGKGCGIHIGNTSEHFIVRNCYVHDINGSLAEYYWNSGLLIYNVENGTFIDNLVENGEGCGILTRWSGHVNISGNSALNNIQGIMIDHSEHITVRENNASYNDQNGIILSVSDHNLVERNSAYYNVWGNGIDVYSSFLNEVKGNIVRNNLNDGIYNQVSWNNNITGNIVEGNDNGIVFSASDSSNITDNICTKNIKSGIYFYKSPENNVSKNDCSKNGFNGIYVRNSNTNSFSDNSLKHNNGSGIYLSSSKRTVIEENVLLENEDRGIWLDSLSNNNTVHHNDIEKNEFGILLTEQSNDNTIRDNKVLKNEHGLRISDSNYNMIYHNMILENPDQSLDDGTGNRWYMDYPICGNYWSDHSSSDQFNGISQDVVGADGISDTPYSNILGTAGSIDRYPLLHKGMNGADVSPPSSSMVSFDICTSDPALNLIANAKDGQSEVVSVEFWYQSRSFSGTWSLWKKH